MSRRGNRGKRPLAPDGGWEGQRKTPRQSRPDESTKRPYELHVDSPAIEARRPVWRFADLDDGGSWRLHDIDASALSGLLGKLKSFESMTIGELFAPGEQHGKRYPVADMPAHVRKRLTEIDRDDETELVRLRCGGRPRLYGFLREHVFHILWWDPNHRVYPSQKKHT